MTIIDKPVLESVVLDETILDNTLTCTVCPEPAAWSISMRCCPHGDYGCHTHKAEWETLVMRIFLRGFGFCMYCQARHESVDSAYRVNPI